MSSNNPNFYGAGGGSVTNHRQSRPPPPNPAGTTPSAVPTAAPTATSSATSTSRRTTTTAGARPRPAYRSSRATAAATALSRPSGTAASGAASATRGNPRNGTTASSSSSPSRGGSTAMNRSAGHSLSGATRTAPVASRPVGSYYNSAPVAAVASVAATSTPAADVGTANNENDTWDDWGSPEAKPLTNPQSQSHSSWAAPAPSNDPAASANANATNDWYSAPSATGYTSSGFNHQQQQSRQQQEQQPQAHAPMQAGNGFYQVTNNNNTLHEQQQQQEHQQQQPLLSGAMDSSAPTMSAMMHMHSDSNTANLNSSNIGAASTTTGSSMPSFSMFMPSASMQEPGMAGGDSYADLHSMEDEAPLLEEIGINIQHILLKTKTVVVPFSRFGGDQIDPHAICQEADLPGPVFLLLLLGGEMVLTGKLQFGYIYVYGLLGCIAMTLVANLISPTEAVSFWTVTSIMGYSLLPVNLLALVKILCMDHLKTLGNILGALTVVWSTLASTRLLELGCGLRDQRYLVMYPLLLFYSAFVMMTIF